MTFIKPLKIGAVTLSSNLLLAPLAGYTDIAFRKLCREFGAGLTTTEMVSVRGLNHNSKKTEALLLLSKNETPSCAQLFGSLPADFSVAIEKEALRSFDIIDLNMGCPMPKIVKNGDGSALLDHMDLAAEIVTACVKTGRTVTVKVRLGVTDKTNAMDFCRMIESAGAAAVTIHGRTAAQLYGGYADWDSIGNIAAKLKIPVIGNGDVDSAEAAEKRMKDYGVAGVMIGRGAIGNPKIFCGDSGVLQDKKKACALTLKETILKHIAYSLEYFSDSYTVKTLRKHFCYYLKGVPNTKDLKAQINGLNDTDTLIAVLEASGL